MQLPWPLIVKFFTLCVIVGGLFILGSIAMAIPDEVWGIINRKVRITGLVCLIVAAVAFLIYRLS